MNNRMLYTKFKIDKWGSLVISLFLLFSFTLAYVYGYNNKNTVISAIFDNLAYQLDDGKYEHVAHGLINIESENKINIYKNLHQQTYFNKMGEDIQSYVLAGNISNERPFNLTFKGFEGLKFETNGISSVYYSDNNYKLEMVDIKLFKETSLGGGRPVFYLPSSIADKLIAYNSNDEFNTYDDILERLEVTVLLNDGSDTPLNEKKYKNFKVRNIFLDEDANLDFQISGGYGKNIKDFIGPYFISNFSEMYEHAGSQLGFTTKSSFFSLKNYLDEYFYSNEDINDANVQIYGIKNNEKHLVFDAQSVNDIFEPELANGVGGIIALLFSLLLFILTILLTIISFGEGLKENIEQDKRKMKQKLITKYILAGGIHFLAVHLIYAIFFNNIHAIWIFRSYNIIGNVFTLIITTIYLITLYILYYLQLKKAQQNEESHE